MRNLTIHDSHIKVDQRLRRAAIRLIADDDDATPETAAMGQALEYERKTVRMRVDAWELAVILVAIWVQRVQRRDQAVGKATADLVKALNAYTDEPAVAAVLPLAVPSPASTAIRGLADETQRHYVANLIDRVKAAPGMPAKVLQRLAALEGAVAKLEAAVIARREAEHAEYQARRELDLAVAAAREVFNAMYFRVGALFPKDKARVEAYFG